MYVCLCVCFAIMTGSLVRKLPSYGRMSRGSLVIMSSSRQHHGRRSLCFRCCGPRSGTVVDKTCTRLQRELDLHFKMFKNWHARITFERWGRQNAHQTEARARFHIKIDIKTEGLGAAPDLCECWLIWCRTPAMRVCNRLWQNALARLRTEKHEWCCDNPGKRDYSWKLLNPE